jgi:hypothetical protein
LVAFLALATHATEPPSLPTSIEGFSRGETTNFEAKSKGLGVGAAYSVPGAQATVYVYNLNIAQLSQDPRSPEVAAQAKQAAQDIRASWHSVEVLEDLALGSDACSSFWRMALKLRDPRSEQPAISYLYVGSKRGSFVKIRVTYPASHDSPEMRAVQTRFAQGACGL